MTRWYCPTRTGGGDDSRNDAPGPALLHAEDRLCFGPVLLEGVVVALGRREDVDDHRSVVEQDPVRGRCALASDRPELLVPQATDDAVGDGVELPLRPARADDEVVGQRRQRIELEQDDVGRLLVLRQLDDAARELERRTV